MFLRGRRMFLQGGGNGRVYWRVVESLNVIEKVGLVDFIGERSSAILSLFLSFSLAIYFLSLYRK